MRFHTPPPELLVLLTDPIAIAKSHCLIFQLGRAGTSASFGK